MVSCCINLASGNEKHGARSKVESSNNGFCFVAFSTKTVLFSGKNLARRYRDHMSPIVVDI